MTIHPRPWHRPMLAAAALLISLSHARNASAAGFHACESIPVTDPIGPSARMAAGDVTGLGNMAIGYYSGSQFVILEDSDSGWRKKAAFSLGSMGNISPQTRFALQPGVPGRDIGYFLWISSAGTISVARHSPSGGWSVDAVLGPFNDMLFGGFSAPAYLAGSNSAVNPPAWRIAVAGNNITDGWMSVYFANVSTPSDMYSLTQYRPYYPATMPLTGDFDANGRTDVALASGGANGIVVDYATAAGNFGGWTTTAYSPAHLKFGNLSGAGKFDPDTRDDIAYLVADTLWTLLSTGSAWTVVPSPAPYPAQAANDMAMGDLNGDGMTDAAVVYGNSGFTWLCDGNGQFTIALPIGTSGAYACAIADVDGDGHADVIVGSGGSIDIFHGDGNGAAGPPHGIPLANSVEYGLALTDVLHDGNMDVVVTGEDSTAPLQVLAGDGAGGFNNLGTYPGSGAHNFFIAPIPQNGLGFAGVGTGNPVSLAERTTPNGSWNLTNVAPILFYGDAPVNALATGHFVSGSTLPGFAIASGTFVPTVETFDSQTSASSGLNSLPYAAAGVLAAPLAGHAYDDLAVVSQLGDLTVLINDGTGHFPSEFDYVLPYGFDSAPPRSHLLAVTHLGSAYTLLAATGFGSLMVMPIQSDGSLGSAVEVAAGDELTGVATGDLNGDGNRDVAVSGFFIIGGNARVPGVRVLYGDGLGGFAGSRILFTTDPVDPADVQVADMDGVYPDDLVFLDGDIAALTQRSGARVQTVGGSLAVLPGFIQPTAVAAVTPGPAKPWTGFAITASPNPTRSGARVSFELPSREPIDVRVLDVTGRRVASIASGIRDAGHQELRWDGRDGSGQAVRAGLYFVRLTTGSRNTVARVVVTP